MSAVIYLHGNPGTPDDFALVRAEAALAGRSAVCPGRPANGAVSLSALVTEVDRLIAAAAAGRGSVDVVGYSWGAYLALQHALRGTHRATRLVLVNPYLVVENPLGSVAPLVLGLPVVGNAILRRSVPRWTSQFIASSFCPGSPPADIAADLARRLGDLALWRSAVGYKRLQQAEPLAALDRLPCPISLVRGADDDVAHWERQSPVLARVLGSIDDQVIAGAGHALPWTHPGAIAELIAARRSAA